MSLKQIKNKIKSVAKTRQVTKAMEAVSAAKMRKSQDKAFQLRPYAAAAFRVLHRVSHKGIEKHAYLQERSAGKTLVIVIVSDRGLAGNLNNGVLRKVMQYCNEHGLTPQNTDIIVHGRKAADFFGARGFTIIQNQTSKADYPNIEEIETILTKSSAAFLAETYREVFVAYPNFISTFEQTPVLRKLFPINEAQVQEAIRSLAKGKSHANHEEQSPEEPSDALYLFEPDEASVLDTVLLYLAKVFLYHALLEAKASEFSARMVAMKNAQDKAQEIGKALNITYNKARQSAITREISEIVGGMEALKV